MIMWFTDASLYHGKQYGGKKKHIYEVFSMSLGLTHNADTYEVLFPLCDYQDSPVSCMQRNDVSKDLVLTVIRTIAAAVSGTRCCEFSIVILQAQSQAQPASGTQSSSALVSRR